jgi:hypothetical protein
MKTNTVRAEILQRAKKYVVIDDGQFQYPMLLSDTGADTADTLRDMGADAYSHWCATHPADLRYAEVGSQECIDLCRDLIEAGCICWRIA